MLLDYFFHLSFQLFISHTNSHITLGPPVMPLLSRQSVPTSFHSGIASKLPIQAWNKAKISPYTLLKMALSKHEKSRRFVVVFVLLYK